MTVRDAEDTRLLGVTKDGNSAVVRVDRSWIGRRVHVILLPEQKEPAWSKPPSSSSPAANAAPTTRTPRYTPARPVGSPVIPIPSTSENGAKETTHA